MPDEISCTLSGLPDGKYRFLGENRTVNVKNGKLNDRLTGHTACIYTNDEQFPAPVDIKALETEIAKVDAAARKAAENLPAKPVKKKKTGKSKRQTARKK